MTANFGVDFGGVIVRNHIEIADEDTGLVGRESADIAHDGVFEALREVVSICNGQDWIVSKAGPRMQERTRSWLDDERFFDRTNMSPQHVRFCRKRAEKDSICRKLGISHFIDDRVHVMQILRYTVLHLYLFGDIGKKRFFPPWATYVFAWEDVPGLLKASL